ncbi:MAG: tetratricopeptide repeat protein [Burkholderiales bacterium]
MSLINRMLRDLDRRHATEGGMEATEPGRLAEQVRPVTDGGMASTWFWRAAALAMLFALGGIGWLVWQSIQRPVVGETAQSSRERISPPVSPAKAEAPPPAAPVFALQALPAAAPSSVPESVPAVPAPAVPVSPVPVPALAQPAATPQSGKAATRSAATPATTPVPQRRARPAASRPAPGKPGRLVRAEPVQLAPTGEPDAPGKIDRRLNTNPRERVENEFRRAVNLVNQGRIAEAMEGFRGVLRIDPGHEAARQTLVALALEAQRVDDAAVLLEQGLALNAENSGFAMLLARIKVERGDVPGALALLQKHAVPPDRNPDFHAFSAALHQRLERHQEAIEQYRAALAIAPSAGVWWVGLGISYQAAQQPGQALEAFRRAKAAGNLAPELSSFVEQRLKQLQ